MIIALLYLTAFQIFRLVNIYNLPETKKIISQWLHHEAILFDSHNHYWFLKLFK